MNMTPKFNVSFERLNPEQREAVECLDGPLLVIAGPGTGKTQLLSLRAANILAKRDAAPRNILCLTYTEAGAEAMRKRLIELIGATPTASKSVRSTDLQAASGRAIPSFSHALQPTHSSLACISRRSSTACSNRFPLGRPWAEGRPICPRKTSAR